MSECNFDCGSCSADCSERQENPGIEKAPMNSLSDVRKVIGVVSGKGGVGKSSITSLLAAAAQRQGKKVAVLDADITAAGKGRHLRWEGPQAGVCCFCSYRR